MSNPTVEIIDAWVSSDNHATARVFGTPGKWRPPDLFTCLWPFCGGRTMMCVEWRLDGGDWYRVPWTEISESEPPYIPSGVPVTSSTWYNFSAYIPHGTIKIEFRGRVDWYGWVSGTWVGYAVSDVWSFDTDSTSEEGPLPYVLAEQAFKTNETTANIIGVGSLGDSGDIESGDLFAQYREIGASSWTSTTKITINEWTRNIFGITGLDGTKSYEARCGLDYVSLVGPITIYSAARPIADSAPDGLECEEFPSSGSGTLENPYIIRNLCQLNWIGGDDVEYPASHRLQSYYELGNNIDASLTRYWYWSGSKYQGFRPIGSLATAFKGYFDGKEYTILNLYVDRVNAHGLFTLIEDNNPANYIKNLTLASPYVVGVYCGEVYTYNKGGGILAGAIVGDTTYRVKVENVHVTDGHNEVTGKVQRYHGGLVGQTNLVDLSYCSFEGFVQHYGSSVGGMVGRATTSTFYRCRVNATVLSLWRTGYFDYGAGGMAAEAPSSTFEECYTEGYVEGTHEVGGFVGRSGTIINCYTRAESKARSGSYSHFAGGFLATGAAITNSYVAAPFYIRPGTNVSGVPYAEGYHGLARSNSAVSSYFDSDVAGTTYSNLGTDKTTAEMKTQATFTGWDFNEIWAIDPAVNDGYPYLRWIIPDPIGDELTDLFVRGNEIQAIFSGVGYRSPDFGVTWYEMEGLPPSARSVGFDASNSQNSFVGCSNQVYVVDSVVGNTYHYSPGPFSSINGTVLSVSVDLYNVGAIGTEYALYKTLDFGNKILLWYEQPVTDVSVGGARYV